MEFIKDQEKRILLSAISREKKVIKEHSELKELIPVIEQLDYYFMYDRLFKMIYNKGRADAICEVNEKMNDFKEKAIEAYGVFICEACADAFTDTQEWILSQMKEGTND